jgi:glutathione synthase/RimK-type ligase-like ATP-grasp enzyme
VQTLIVVNDPEDWPLALTGVELVPARAYLTDPHYSDLRGTRVYNLCRSYRYQSLGYYVSLLAEARGHKPLPSVTTVQDLKSQTIVRVASEELDELIQKSLAPIHAKEFTLSIYFGRNLAKRYDRLSQHLFSLFQAPFLRSYFVYNGKIGKWSIGGLGPVAASEIPEEHRPFVVEVAQEYFQGRRRKAGRRAVSRYDLAILADPKEAEPPSDEKALQKFVRAAESVGLNAEFLEKEDFGRLAEFDALFIRETTSVNHHTYRFARKAAAEGLVVVDDPESILKCTNKVFLAELLERNRVLTPKTLVVHRGNRDVVARDMGLPCILKQPDSSFSRGVVKVDGVLDLKEAVGRLLERSELVIAQEFLPTPFDWRVGIFDRQPLYACKYFMARRHWQVFRRESNGIKTDEGKYETLPVEHIPTQVLRTALKAANLIGDGLYGVDLKQVGRKVYVIEVNDNPNIESGVEDQVLKEEIYIRIMRVFLRRIEQRKAGVHP